MGFPITYYYQWILLFLLLISHAAIGQELPPVVNFTPSQYEGGNQNWMISQGENAHIFVANNSGLLQFDGEHWNLYEVTGGAAVRSVLASEEMVYTGSYMDFGYWQANATGRLQYTSLKDSVNVGMMDGEQFWDIKEVGDYVIFQSHQRLYSFNKKTGKVQAIVTETNISNLFTVNDKIYYQVAEKGLFVIEKGAGNLFISNEKIGNKPIIGLFPFAENKMLAITRDDGLFMITGNQWEVFPVENYPSAVSFFSALYLEDGTLALGSIGSGLYLINLNGSSDYQLSQPTLQNNTVLSVMEDKEGNIWGGLDNGITLINKKSPFRLFVDTFGEIGTVYCSSVIDEIRYLGTNQGLYYKQANDEEGYRLVPGTTGQVWSINYLDGKIFIGHDRGTFLVEGTSANLIWDGLGTWVVKRFGEGILQGHYNGLSYRADEGYDSAAHYLKDFDLSSRNIIVENDSVIWLSHYHKGIFKLELDQEYSRVLKAENYLIKTDSGLGPQIFTFNNEIYYSTETAIYRYDRDENVFSGKNELNELTEGYERISGVSQVLEDGSWWSFGRDKLYFVTRDPFEQRLVLGTVPLPLENRNITKGFENISLIGKNRYLVGSNVGYIEFSLPLGKITSGELSINAVETGAKGANFEYQPLDGSGLELENKINTIKFHFSVPGFQKLTNIQYSYRILNYSSSWSKWSETGIAEFENLPAGSYTFQVKGRSNENETEVLSYQFVIARPWYLTNLAIAGYFLLFLLGLLVIHFVYRRHHEKVIREREKNLRMQALEAEQKVIKLQKEHLEKDMADKNEQLAASTMSLIRKNEFLSILKEELKDTETTKVKGVIKTIDKEISEEDNWKMFKEAFKNADKEFFDKIKSKHPELTSNDLRLCAYLRLNLSSKEIAPLINISVKSVEIKRYRLRKKMGLPREVNLTDYIMNL